MPFAFDATSYDTVRKLIDLGLGTDTLPDTVLELDAFLGEATRYVERRTENTDASAHNAVLYRLASVIIPSVPQFVSQSNAGFSYQLQARNWENRIAQLQQMAEDAIARSEAENPTDVGTAWSDGNTMSQFDVAAASVCAI